mgnify:CR=1 FL=1
MNVEDLLDEIDEVIDKSFELPLSGGKSVIDVCKIKEIIEELRLHMPKEFRQAKAIVADRGQIISDAKAEAESIIRVAQEKAKAMVDKEEIVKNAQEKANDIIEKSNQKSREMKKVASEYVDDLMKRTDEALSEYLMEIRKTRQSLKVSQRSSNEE